ncbi:MAG: leucyl aminopeptidase [Kurthia sp.]|nr:leucyl aminopeptidase [Candidatus Kurthia equi]
MKNQQLATIEAEVLIVGVSEHQENLSGWSDFKEIYGPNLDEWIKNLDISTAVKGLTKLPTTLKNVKRVLYVGLGQRKTLTPDDLRAAFAATGKELAKSRVKTVGLWVDSLATDEISVTDAAILAMEGLVMGSFQVENYKTTNNQADVTIEEMKFISAHDQESILASLEVGEIYGNAVNSARDLINLPGNVLTATALANYAEELATKYDFEIEVLDKAQLEELGMGAILAVNKGSKEEPRLITIKYNPKEDWEDVVTFVGKGVTFDTGGYSIKSKSGIVGMKGDMGGAASVLGAMQIIGELRPNHNVMAVIGSTDNMIDGNAFKPDDVITTYSGKTVEILNTDAEGRLVLADAVAYAKQQGATSIIDLATLTGGVITALGFDKTGALTNNQSFYNEFHEATEETGEFTWLMPLTENDKKRIRKSDVADLNNSPGGDGHMIFGGGFVGEFVGETPWIHLDIAGTSDANAPHDLGPKGGTGVMVRSLATYIMRITAQNK